MNVTGGVFIWIACNPPQDTMTTNHARACDHWLARRAQSWANRMRYAPPPKAAQKRARTNNRARVNRKVRSMRAVTKWAY